MNIELLEEDAEEDGVAEPGIEILVAVVPVEVVEVGILVVVLLSAVRIEVHLSTGFFTYVVVVVMVVETSAGDIDDESVLRPDDVDGCAEVTDEATSLEVWVLELIDSGRVALPSSPTRIPATIPLVPGTGACGASLR